MNSSGEPAARARARRSSSPGARSSRWATASGGRPARRATSSTNSLSITSHRSSAATSRATSEPPEAYCRVTVMTGGAISGLQVLSHLADVEQREPALGRRDPLLGHQPLEHQLARRDHGTRVFLPGEAHLVHQVEQAGDDAEALEAALRALVHRDFERPALVEPVDDVIHVGAAHPGLE